MFHIIQLFGFIIAKIITIIDAIKWQTENMGN